MKAIKNPKISVLMPVYNGQAFLQSSIESILEQDYSDFELLAIDDGSSDDSVKILESYACEDPRIRIIRQEKNCGIVATLNHGLEIAKAEYIARMDADDIALPKRLGQQIRYFERNPNVAVVGTGVNFIDKFGRKICAGPKYPTHNNDIKPYLFRDCCLFHPSVMVRKSVIKALGGYRNTFRHAEDYDLWFRVSEKYDISNISDILMLYRIHPNQVSLDKIVSQNESAEQCRRFAAGRLSEMGRNCNFKHLSLYEKLTAKERSLGRDYLNWSILYQLMGQEGIALQCAIKAAFQSPFRVLVYINLIKSLTERYLPPIVIKNLKWRWARITDAFKNLRKAM